MRMNAYVLKYGLNQRFGWQQPGLAAIVLLASIVAGIGVGGALMGLIVGGVTILVSAPLLRLMASGLGTPASLEGLRYGVLGVLALLAASHDLSVLKLPLPHFLRQVPRAWVYDLPPIWTSIGFGLQLGALFLTVMPLAAVYVVVLYGGLTGNLLAGVLLGAAVALLASVGDELPTLLLPRAIV